jgi:hypothetical protein
MRTRSQILDSLETSFRRALEDARERDDAAEAARLELDFVRDQLQLEVLLDLRALLLPDQEGEPEEAGSSVAGILDTAARIRNLTRLR